MDEEQLVVNMQPLIPGGGWMYTCCYDCTDIETTPVVAWDNMHGYVAVGDGSVYAVGDRGTSKHYVVWHPDMKPVFNAEDAVRRMCERARDKRVVGT